MNNIRLSAKNIACDGKMAALKILQTLFTPSPNCSGNSIDIWVSTMVGYNMINCYSFEAFKARRE